MVETSKRLTANACLHRHHIFPRRFLRRNLRHILDSHERELRILSSPTGSTQRAPDDDASGGMIANERRAAGWDFPTKEMLDDLTKGDKPVLRLDALQIRHPKAGSTRKRKRSVGDDHEERLDWLPDPDALATWPCQVTVTVHEKDSNRGYVHADSRNATISQYRKSKGGYSDFDILLAEPFLIEVSKLFVAVETGTNGFRHWRRTIPTSYDFTISIKCPDSDTTADFLSELEQLPRNSFERRSEKESSLRASWTELPKCPGAGERLPLKRRGLDRSITMEHRLEVSMGWTRKRESPLQRYNKATVATSGCNRQLPTPSYQENKKAVQHIVTYKFCEGHATRVKTVEGLHCPLCRELPETFGRLLLHFSTFHDHFRFEVDESPDDAPDASIVSKTIALSVSPQIHFDKVTENGADEKSNWVAPRRPFDMEAHLKGDDTWTGFSKPKLTKKRGRPSGPQSRDSGQVVAPRPVARRPEPEHIQDFPLNGRKKYVVPNVPGVRFYHTLSKKPLAPGEMISDSDETVDEFWMTDIQRLALKDFDVNGGAQEFTLAFNRHLAREQSTSSVLMKEAVVRFTRLHRGELQKVDWQRPFRKKLDQLLKAGVLDQKTVTHCIQLLQVDKTNDDVEMTNGIPEGRHGSTKSAPLVNGERKAKQRVRWGTGGAVGGDSEADTQGRYTPSTATNGTAKDLPNGLPGQSNIRDRAHTEAPRPKVNSVHNAAENGSASRVPAERTCVCGSSARNARGAIICANLKCRRKDFHLRCVGLESRQHGWKCSECA